MDWIPLQPNDVILDVGCGDANVLLQWATLVSSSIHESNNDNHNDNHTKNSTAIIKFLGIEIDKERAALATENVERAYREGMLDRNKVTIQIHCGNALDNDSMSDWFAQATIVFLYLIPRGLRLIQPLLRTAATTATATNRGKSPLRVITYMSPLAEEMLVSQRYCTVKHQPGSAWPLYLYHIVGKKQM